MAAILLVTAAILVVIFSLKQSAEKDYIAGDLAHVIVENCQALNALEWQAIASGKMETAIMENIEERRAAVDEALDGLIQLYPDETKLATMQQGFDRYKKATGEEFDLLSAGRIPEAVAIDEESVDPLFERLVAMATATSIAHHERANSNSSTSYYLISLISLLTVIITGLLLWLYFRILWKHRQISMEKTVLALSEERFRSVAQSANEAIITINGRGKVTYWNSAATHMFGYKKDEALGQAVSFIMPERFREGYLAGMKRVTTTDQTKIIGRTVEFAGLKKDGSEFPLEISISRWQAQQGTFFTAIIRDITKRKQAEEQVASQSNALEQRHLQLAALYEIGSTISGTIELQELLDNALEKILASGLLQMQHKAGILLVKDNKLTLVSHLGLPEEFLALHKEIASGECLCGMAMERGEIIISYDSSRDDRHTISYPGMEPHGHVIGPLKAGW